jgi:hypothetical protein
MRLHGPVKDGHLRAFQERQALVQKDMKTIPPLFAFMAAISLLFAVHFSNPIGYALALWWSLVCIDESIKNRNQ